MPKSRFVSAFLTASLALGLASPALAQDPKTVFTVVIPSARVGLVLAPPFGFILSFGDYVAPTMLGGGKPPTHFRLPGHERMRAAAGKLFLCARLL